MHGAIPPLPQYVVMAWCLVKHGDNFTFTFIIKCNGTAARIGLSDLFEHFTLEKWQQLVDW